MSKVATSDALRFMTECLKAVGTAAKAAEQQAELLLQADRLGHPSHGMNRLEFYINDILSGACKPNNQPKVLKENASTAWVDADSTLGAVASHFAMDIAIKKAKETGVGWVTVKGSNHNGMAGFWAKKASDKGLIGMAFTNTSPLLAPTRSKKAALGTNPLSVVAPGSNGETLYVDMATTAVAVGKIEIQRRKGEPIPSGWAQSPDGKETTDANLGAAGNGARLKLPAVKACSERNLLTSRGVSGYWSRLLAVRPFGDTTIGTMIVESTPHMAAFETGCLMPLGGQEHTSGYKGYGLAAMVELFCGISSGSKYGHHVRSWSHSSDGRPANLGHCFVAVDPECFAPGFGDRLAESMDHWRHLEPTDPNLPVLAPGDKELAAAKVCDESGTVSYLQQQIDASAALAKKLKVTPMKIL